MNIIDLKGSIMGFVGFATTLLISIPLGTDFWQALLSSSMFGIFMMLLASGKGEK